MTAYQMKEVVQEYRRLRAMVPLGTLRTKKDYVRAVEMLDAILDETGEDENHPMAELADTLSVFFEKYEAEQVRIPLAKPESDAMKTVPLFPRYLLPRLRDALADTPAVLVHDPRQCGKMTLARMLGKTLRLLYL